MKVLKKAITGIAALSVMATQFAGVSFAAEKPTCLNAAANAGKVAVGDTFSVELKMSEMTASSYVGGIRYDGDYVSVPAISDSSAVLAGTRTDTNEANNLTLHTEQGENNNVGIYGVGAYDTSYAAGDVTVLTFTAEKAGKAKFSLYEDYDSQDKDQINEEFGTFTIDILQDPGTAALTVIDGEGTSHEITADAIKAAASVTTTEENPWGYGTNKFVGTFYSLKNILDTAGLDISEAHGIKAVATDGFATGFGKEDIENLYIYDMGTVMKNGAAAGDAGTYGTAINKSAGNKWAKGVAKISVATGHEWFIKGGACKHYCSICGESEPFTVSWQWVTSAEPYTAKANLHYDCGADVSMDAVVTSKALSDGGKEYTATVEAGGKEYTDVRKSSGTGGVPSGDAATQDTKIDPAVAQNNLFGTDSTIDVTGGGRADTSMKLADQVKKTLGVKKFSTIILASGADFPDGLGVSALSIQQRAPVLIVTPGAEASIRKYIEENLVNGGKVIISGGTGAVSQNMQDSLKGIEVSRLGGAGRYDTNLLTIKELLAKGAGKDEILIASGKDFADALSASATGKIIMIVGDKLTDEQKTLLGETGFGKVTILGGTGAVSGSVENELNAVTGKKAERVGGEGRIETSKLIAERDFPGSTTSVYTKAYDFADGLAGGLLANITGSPMRLAFGAKDMTAGGKNVTLGGVK